MIEGFKEGFWTKIGNIPIEDNFDPPVFRQTNDAASSTGKSEKWFIWKKQFANRRFIGALTDEYRSLPISSIFPPQAIVRWLEMGDTGFKMPD